MYRQLSLKSLALLASAFPALISSSFAADTQINFTQALQEASDHSPALQKLEAQRDEAKWKKVESFSLFLPQFSITGSHYFEKRYQLLTVPFGGNLATFPQIFPATSASLQGRWLIFDGFSNVQQYRGASYLKDAAESEYNWARFQLEEEVRLGYDRVVASKKLLAVADENLKTLQTHLDQVKKLKGGGVATSYDVLRVEAQLSVAQAEYLQAQDNIQIAQERLGQILGSGEPQDVQEGELETPMPEKVRPLQFREHETKRLDIQALQERVYASDLRDSASGRFWVPKISLGGDYTLYNNLTDPINDWQRYRVGWSAGVFLQWDIFNPAEFARSKEEAYHAIADQKSLKQSMLSMPVDFAFWKKRYLYNATLFTARKIDLDRAQETVRLAQAGFRAGVRTTTDVIDAELELFRARAGVVNALIDCTEAKTKLELSLGEKI